MALNQIMAGYSIQTLRTNFEPDPNSVRRSIEGKGNDIDGAEIKKSDTPIGVSEPKDASETEFWMRDEALDLELLDQVMKPRGRYVASLMRRETCKNADMKQMLR